MSTQESPVSIKLSSYTYTWNNWSKINYFLSPLKNICCCLVTKSWLTLVIHQTLCPWNFPGKNTRVGCYFLLQGNFPRQGSNSNLLLGRWILYHWATWEAPPKKNRNLLRVLRDFGRWQRSRCTRNTSLSKDTSGIHLQTQKCMQNTSWEQTGVPAQQKRICRRTQNLVGWRN